MANKNTSIVKFDTSIMSLVEKDGKNFLFKPEAEDALAKWLEFVEQVEAVGEMVKENLQSVMDENNTKKIDSERVKVYSRVYGSKYEITNREDAQGFTKEVTTVRPDGDAIDEYVDEHEELPNGVKLKERTAKVTIKLNK